MSGQEFNSTGYPTARKSHHCDECGRTITPGERYSRTAAVWEGEFFTNVACLHCALARMIVDEGDAWYSENYYHGLREWLGEYASDQSTSWALRLLMQVDRRWQRFDGAGLMDLPANPWPEVAGLSQRLDAYR